ncbi:MAG: putative beta-lysine N-acetyltransferase [Chlorobiaceae bacterium]|nr:putative beta-lysine N-acetyltransferase [Chlorobiaceae bacterium]
MQRDLIETCCGATIQHGPQSNRIYVMHAGASEPGMLAVQLAELALRKRYTKIIAKIPEAAAASFFEQGYCREAEIPEFYRNGDTALFMARFFDDSRACMADASAIARVLELSQQALAECRQDQASGAWQVCQCGPADAKEMSGIYRKVFPSYPFPIDQPEYLQETMLSHIEYFGVRDQDRLVALASSEMDRENRNVEMTDFATLPERRGRSLSHLLLMTMEREMRQEGFVTAYTIARSLSPGINRTFARAGYLFGGTLINNTGISGGIESMNVWHKPLG